MRKKVVYFSTSGPAAEHAPDTERQGRTGDALPQLSPAEYDAVLKTLQRQMKELISNNKVLSC